MRRLTGCRRTIIALSVLAVWLLSGHASPAQTPSQYPPSQYPPGQYPPGQYPPGQYPQDPSTYPGRLPGGVQLPRIPWPKKKPKEDKKDEKGNENEVRVELNSMEGTLRELASKHLLLASGGQVYKFRLLAKTRFQDKSGEPVRDSLLQPGDMLSVQASKEDPETAMRVTLLRSGSAADKAEASKPVDTASIRVPEAGDLGRSSGPSKLPPAGRGEDKDDEPAPRTGETAGTHVARDESAARRLPTEATSLPPDLQVLADARDAAAAFAIDLPNYVVEQNTTRSHTNVDPPDWKVIDVVTAEVSCVNGKERYADVRINGRPPDKPLEKSGTWTTGEFVTTLQDLFAPDTDARFERVRDGRAASRPAYVYSYAVDAKHSNWILVDDRGERYKPAHSGEIWIDKESRRVLRIEQRAGGLPASFGIEKAETRIDYGFVRIDNGTYLLPVESESLGCKRGTAQCSRNITSFRNYRKFSAESRISY
ncbi:MAG: hypothetical protein HXY18_05540 [Bryobacteraceae bacterium]|nr:hypothetical protein [Bryobacteraceae bacterium]